MFSGKNWLRCGDYATEMTSKSSNTKHAALRMQFSVLNWHTNDCKCEFTLLCYRILHAFVYLLDGNDYIDVFP